MFISNVLLRGELVFFTLFRKFDLKKHAPKNFKQKHLQITNC